MQELTICAIFMIGLISKSSGHVSLTFPPARKYDLDFLDTFRTNKPCGGMPKGNIKTTIPLNGEKLKVEWHLGYSHGGGIKLELLDAQEQKLLDLTPDFVLTNVNEKYETSYEVAIPNLNECRDCVIRLTRQATEWGTNYQFMSCADVDIVKNEDYVEDCLGRGNAQGSYCECDKPYFGERCQFFQDCDNDADCGNGLCLENPGTAMPRKECYCPTGFFGRYCEKPSPIKSKEYNSTDYTMVQLDGGVKFLWRTLGVSGKTFEGIITAETSSYLAIGWRAKNAQPECQNFPTDVSPPKVAKQLHLMDCQDVVVGKVRNGMSNVGDYYTRDRSTPRRDEIYGGTDDLEGAAGFEEDGYTTIIFRKPVSANHGSDNPFVNELEVIYAFGQANSDFYKEDELKYHSGNRGHIVFQGIASASSSPALLTPLLTICSLYFLWISN